MDRTEEQLQGRCQQAPSTSSEEVVLDVASDLDENDAEDDAIIPSAHKLKELKQIQDAVDKRLKDLTTLNEKGTFKSQRGVMSK